MGHPNASNFVELIILIRQIVCRILAKLDARFGADQSGIMRAAACCLPNSQNFLNKQELDTLSELYAISIKDCEIEVFRSFIARQDDSQLQTLIDVLDIIDKDIFLMSTTYFRFLLLSLRRHARLSECSQL